MTSRIAIPDEDSAEIPECPKCGSPMSLRTARRGLNAGGQFWGCTKYPSCRGTLDAKAAPSRSTASATERALPVTWIEGVGLREHIAEYASIGALPGVVRDDLPKDLALERLLSQTLLLYRQGRKSFPSDHSDMVSGLLVKVLQRGHTPLPTLGVEREALRVNGIIDKVDDLSQIGKEVGWDLGQGTAQRPSLEVILKALSGRLPFVLHQPLDYHNAERTSLVDSQMESWFLNRWVADTLGPEMAHWFTPQASLDTLLEASGKGQAGARRLDFLFCHPNVPPFAVEVDGPEHAASTDVDRTRDAELAGIGIDVIRVTNAEMQQGYGPNLDSIRERCGKALAAAPHDVSVRPIDQVIVDCTLAAKVQLAFARAVGFGWLTPGQDWEIILRGVGSVAVEGIRDALALLAAYDRLYGGQSTPARCAVHADNGIAIGLEMSDDGEWKENVGQPGGESIEIVIEPHASPFHHLPSGPSPDFIIRPCFLPVDFAVESVQSRERRAIVPTSYQDAHGPLTVFLQNIFRKRAFRDNQGEAVYNVLRHNDSIVLLPTGAGKSIIYQLAGMLMPGITLVADPIVALIEDQVDGLRRYGIDRAAPIARALANPEERRRLLLRVERGEYQFVLHSPERLQSPEFRGTLEALAGISLVNLAVIDEAHCVSDWGHDFRPAYLNLAANLRKLGADRSGSPPPLLALSGTASRAVLRDMLTNFDIDRNRSDALIRPNSFNRPELSFDIIRTSPQEDPRAALRGALNSLPQRFRLPRAQFFRTAGRNTASGIVFVPTVNGRSHGLVNTRALVQDAAGADVTIYSGGPPNGADEKSYDAEKRRNAEAFKANRVPLLVATKAFGMGIDKPNIRFTIHYGMPQSLEAFYQEAGRAGRDEQQSLCAVVFSEYDPVRSDELLDPDLDLETLRRRFESINTDRSTGDDVRQSLWFHLEAFAGLEPEMQHIERVLRTVGDMTRRQTVHVPFAGGGDAVLTEQEKAIYRLLRVGVLADYTVEWGARRFVLEVDAFDVNRCKARLRDYVEASQPARSRILQRQLDAIGGGQNIEVAAALARTLLEFTYDVIERSRRRMLQEAVLLARQATNDQEIRTRLLDYLQESFGAEAVDALLKETDIDLGAWLALVLKIQTPIDAGELRGLCIRALESYPDHPGLLLIRAAAEAMSSDHNSHVSAQGISSALQRATGEYSIASDHIDAVVNGLFDLADARAPGLYLPLTFALLMSPQMDYIRRIGKERAREAVDAEVQAIVAIARIEELVDQAAEAVQIQVERYGQPSGGG